MYFHFANSDINCTLCFCFFVLSPRMLQLIIEYKLVCPSEAGVGLITALRLHGTALHCPSLRCGKPSLTAAHSAIIYNDNYYE